MTKSGNSAYLSMMMGQCKGALTTNGNAPNPVATACFPTSFASNSIAALSTASSVYSCLGTASIFCTFESACITKTYTVGQVPSPTPTLGINLVQNSGFESDDLAPWKSSNSQPNIAVSISNARSRSGLAAFLARYLNVNGSGASVTQVVKGLEPGGRYEARMWYMHTNAAATTYISLSAEPGRFAVPELSLNGSPANQWTEMVLSFTPVSSWVELRFYPRGLVAGAYGTDGGKDDIYVDDITLVRLS